MRAVRFIVVLVAGLGLLTWGALVVVQRTTREWFDRDILLRSTLAISGAHDALVSHWDDADPAALRDILFEITRDERIMAAAACSADLTLLARAGAYPAELNCRSIGPHVQPSAGAPPPCGPPGPRRSVSRAARSTPPPCRSSAATAHPASSCSSTTRVSSTAAKR
jgi:hypothetical protein